VSGARGSATTTPEAVGVLAGSLTCAASILAVVTGAAVTVILTGLPHEVRRALGFGFGGLPRSPRQALQIALDNGRLAAGTLICALVVPHLPPSTRRVLDLSLALLLALNAAAIGVAFAGYGRRVLAAVALHLPLELAALSLAGGTYLSTRRHPIGLATLSRVAVLCLLLLMAAATVETYVSPLGGRP
jgi:hypothetical protein